MQRREKKTPEAGSVKNWQQLIQTIIEITEAGKINTLIIYNSLMAID